MLAEVKRVPTERLEDETAEYERGQLTVSDNWVQWSGPGFGFRANAEVLKVSTPYRGADYHFSLEVFATAGQMYRRERWFVRLLEVET